MRERSTLPGRFWRCRSAFIALVSGLALGCSPGTESTSPQVAPAQSAETRVPVPRGSYSEVREPCDARFPLRNAFFGELHVHTKLSMDAYAWDVRGTPDDAYRFARGETVAFPPLDADGRGTRRARLERPLDFAAMTDHAAFLGEVSLCSRAGSPMYDSDRCKTYRGEARFPEIPSGFAALLAGQSLVEAWATPESGVPEFVHAGDLCGEDGGLCRSELRSVWDATRAATESWYDRSSRCEFTTFHAYEYTATPDLSKVHRNVIFRNASLPELPISWYDEPTAIGLWRALKAQCLDAGNGCDVITIPHNSNLSNGRLFTVEYRSEPVAEQRARAQLQAQVERLVEIMQIKGDSECRNGMYGVVGAPDELCDFEKIWPAEPAPPDCEEGTGRGALGGRGCVSRLDFVRYALIEGLREADRLGVNPYRLGIMASTDAHNANPGDAEEYSYQGWAGATDASPEDRLTTSFAVFPHRSTSPGGLVGVWAEENSRDSLFDAMRRRETFGTSGPRMTARLFGGFGYAPELCASPDLVEQGYAGGVPMGGVLEGAPDGAPPIFIVSALRDPGTAQHAGGALQRAQIIKGWVDPEGSFRQAVYDVAGEPDNGASVDLETCEPEGPGRDALCTVWTDPDFDPARRAVYYARVVENPSCRWTQHQCSALPRERRPKPCDDPELPKLIQERLWTSPIWYEPR